MAQRQLQSNQSERHGLDLTGYIIANWGKKFIIILT